MYTDINHFFAVTTINVRSIITKLCLPPHLYSVDTLTSTTNTTADINATCLFAVA